MLLKSINQLIDNFLYFLLILVLKQDVVDKVSP